MNVPRTLTIAVWHKYFGIKKGKGKCNECGATIYQISVCCKIRNDCTEIIPTIDNVVPLCIVCYKGKEKYEKNLKRARSSTPQPSCSHSSSVPLRSSVQKSKYDNDADVDVNEYIDYPDQDTAPNTTPNTDTGTTKKPYKKEKISQQLRELVWNTHIGQDIGETVCKCCGIFRIQQLNFQCGHIVAESKGGATTVDNLTPICGSCNLSMGTKNLNEFRTMLIAKKTNTECGCGGCCVVM